MKPLVPLALTATLALTLAPTAAAGVVVVAADGSGDHTDLPAAVAGAEEGDVLLVRSGTYSGFALDGVSLAIVADAGATVTVEGGSSVTSLSADQRVLLSGLDLRGLAASDPFEWPVPALILDGCAAAVRIQDCTLTGPDGASVASGCDPIDGGSAMHVAACPDVALFDCDLRGGNGGDLDPFRFCIENAGSGGVALNAQTLSRVTLYRCILEGGDGGDEANGGFGGPGAAFTGGTRVFANHSIFRGGDAGDSNDLFCIGGGTGVHAFGPLRLRELDSSFLGGAGGVFLPHGTACDDGPPTLGPVDLRSYSGPVRNVFVERVAREGETVTLTFFGQPGDEVELLVGRGTAHRFGPALRGTTLVSGGGPGKPLARESLGTIPGSGQLVVQRTLGALAAGDEARTLFLQAIVTDLRGDPILTNLSTLVVLDDAF